MSRQPLTLARHNLATPMSTHWRGISLKWKITGTLASVILFGGILMLVTVGLLMGRVLQTQLDRRAVAVATNLSDAAAGHVVAGNSLELHALLTKYALLEGVAYIFVEDRIGRVIAHNLGNFPSELQEPLFPNGRRQMRQRAASFRGRNVQEIRVPILEGQAGAVHVGIWDDALEEEIKQAVFPLLGLVSVMVLACAVVSGFLARGIIRPVLELAQIADHMSKGDLDTPIELQSRDEIGDLARSLERMRASLKAAMVRLSRERSID